MTVNHVSNKITLLGDGTNYEWFFDFPAVHTGYIHFYVTDAEGNLDEVPVGDYTILLAPPIAPNPTGIGGVITYPLSPLPPLPAGSLVTIIRVLDPLQTTSLTNQSIMYPPVIEREFDYLTLLYQQGAEQFARAFRVGPSDPIPAFVPPVAARRNQNAFFDEVGNLTAGLSTGTALVSLAMQPVVSASSLALARELMGISPVPTTVTGAWSIGPGDDRKVLNLTGGYYNVNIGNNTAYAPNFSVFIFNNSLRGKRIVIDGGAGGSFILWPYQFIWFFNTSTGWDLAQPGRWVVDGTVNFYVNYALGDDANDGLANGAQAFKTIQHAVDLVQKQLDGTINIYLDDGVHQVGSGVVCRAPLLGPAGYVIIGNVSFPDNCKIRGDDGAVLFFATGNAVIGLWGMHLAMNSIPTGTPSCIAVQTNLGAVISLKQVNFGDVGTAGCHINALSNSTIYVLQAYTIDDATRADSHIRAESAGTIIYQPGICGLNGVVNISYFVVSTFLGIIHNNGAAISFPGGTNTGVSYIVSYNSIISIGTTPPGSTGSAFSGGLFVL